MDEKLIIDVARLKAEGEEFSGVVDDAVLEIDGELLSWIEEAAVFAAYK